MKEKELRLALVCYGGASLAVYMHGITKEVLKLVRASTALHDIPTLSERRSKSYADQRLRRGDTIDSELVYFDLLKLIGEQLDLRVVVDIVSGASAGGVNGITLARALAHDLDLWPVTQSWLDEGDVEALMTEEVRAKTWSKAYLSPLIHFFSKYKLEDLAPDQEMRDKLSMFLRSRWFEPPFDGPILSDMYFRSIDKMEEDCDERKSLVPLGQRLHLFVTVTDFFGHEQHLRIHDPKLVCEKEHRHILEFMYRRSLGGVETDFDRDHLLGLIFAARATSSYPGAFPPAQIAEVEALFAKYERGWPGKERFLSHNFSAYRRQGLEIETASFIDGGVLNNKPFASAVSAIKAQPAYREVDRRLVYIDPDPEEGVAPDERKPPGFFSTLLGSLSALPRSEPIRDDLAFVGGYNDRIRRVKSMMEAARPRIESAVSALAEEAVDYGIEAARRARHQAHRSVMSEVGLFYEGYLELKIDATLDYVTDLLADFASLQQESVERHGLADVVRAWAEANDIAPRSDRGPAEEGKNPAWLKFLDRFDIGFRDRRIRFVIRALNQLYPRLNEPEFSQITANDLDALKQELYEVLDVIRPFRSGSFIDSSMKTEIEVLLARVGTNAPEDCVEAMVRILDRLHGQMSLGDTCSAVELALTRRVGAGVCRDVRRELLYSYIGYAYWDVLTFSTTNWRSIGEFDEIRVDRISPLDADGIRGGGTRACLKSVDFEGFAGFFSRRARENDYLWGRLHGAERLIDIVCSSVPGLTEQKGEVVMALKRQAFRAILDSEKKKLEQIPDEFARIERELEHLEG